MISDVHQFPQRSLISQEQVNSIDPLENQLCRVCDEKAAGFHFGAFTCEGCKSFFGRFCNNQTVIPECKNNYLCIIDKRNRTSCKACRLKKCLSVGMSKSGCRYGRRSNWFKIHCLLQRNGQKKERVAAPILQQPHPFPRPVIPQPTYHQNFQLSPQKPTLSSRSPSPLNTSNESSSTHSSPSPNSEAARVSEIPHSVPKVPYFHPLANHMSMPMFDPMSLYRLSPLIALSPLLAHAQQSPFHGMDFKQTLDLLAERRALFEKLKNEATCSSPRSNSPEPESSLPVDLSVK